MRTTTSSRETTCEWCGETIERGEKIGLSVEGAWVHAYCASDSINRNRITSGETFRSRRRNDWKRKGKKRE